MFYALMRKELRLHRMAIIVAVAVALVMEGLLPALNYAIRHHQDPQMPSSRHQREFAQSLFQGSGVALMACCLFAAVFGGGSTATERRERWGDFASMLPVPRGRRALAAAVVGAALTLATFSFHAAILLSVDWLGLARVGGGATEFVANSAAMAVGAFGLARLAATRMRSPSLLVTVVCGTLVAGLTLAIFVNDSQRFDRTGPWVDHVGRYLTGVATFGVLALVASFPIAARRVEP